MTTMSTAATWSEFFQSHDGEKLVGTIMLKALTRHFQSYEVDLECRHPDGAVEVKKERGDILGFMAQWIKNSEGAIR